MFQAKVVETIKTQILCSVTFFFFANRAVCETVWKNTVDRAGHRWQYSAYALHAG